MLIKNKTESGFTLVEIAIVLLIVTILLGYSVALLPVQQELRQFRAADDQMEKILVSLYAHAQVNGRLPCPDTDVGTGIRDGQEDAIGAPIDDCEVFFGFLPAKTLGLVGKYNETGNLIDPWGGEYRYAVSEDDAGDGNVDLVTIGGIQSEGMANVLSDLFVCTTNPTGGFDTACAAGEQVVGNIPAVIISMGKDNDMPATSNIQAENIDDFDNGGNDKVYVFTSRQDNYDDIVKWISPNILYSKMIDAGQALRAGPNP